MLAGLQARYPRPELLTMSINISPRQFMQPDFIDQVRRAVSGACLEARSVRLEIMETVAISDPERAILVLAALRDSACGSASMILERDIHRSTTCTVFQSIHSKSTGPS